MMIDLAAVRGLGVSSRSLIASGEVSQLHLRLRLEKSEGKKINKNSEVRKNEGGAGAEEEGGSPGGSGVLLRNGTDIRSTDARIRFR